MPDALLIRCRPCTSASAAELGGWLEDKVAQLSVSAGPSPIPVRLSRLVRDLPAESVDDGWLIEIQLGEAGADGGWGSDSLTATLVEVLRDMLILGLDPKLLVPTAASPLRSGA